MLLTRVLTALVLAPAVLAAVFLLEGRAFAAVFLVVIAAAAWEWGQLCGLGSPGRSRWPLIGYVAAYGVVAWLMVELAPVLPLLALTLALWAWLALRVLRYRAAPETGGFFPVDALAGLLVLVQPLSKR